MSVLVELLLLFSLSADPSSALLPKGTIIKLHLSRPVSSETAAVADPVTFEVTEDVKVGSRVVIPKGSTAEGYVSTRISGKSSGYGGIGVYVGSVRAPSGFAVPVHGTTERGGNPEAVISTDTEIYAATELPLPIEKLVLQAAPVGLSR
jgi:hypothetical protein